MKCPPINLYSYKAAMAMALWIALSQLRQKPEKPCEH